MNMQAIRLSPSNISKIVENTSVTRAQLENIMAHWEWEGEPRYFIPEFTTLFGRNTHSWAVPVEKYMTHNFDFDEQLAQTEFVELTRK